MFDSLRQDTKRGSFERPLSLPPKDSQKPGHQRTFLGPAVYSMLVGYGVQCLACCVRGKSGPGQHVGRTITTHCSPSVLPNSPRSYGGTKDC